MSHDIFFNPITRKAGLYLPDLHGLTGAQAAPLLASALMYLTNSSHSRSLRKLEPINGWGTLDHTISFLTRMYFTLMETPDELIGVHS